MNTTNSNIPLQMRSSDHYIILEVHMEIITQWRRDRLSILALLALLLIMRPPIISRHLMVVLFQFKKGFPINQGIELVQVLISADKVRMCLHIPKEGPVAANPGKFMRVNLLDKHTHIIKQMEGK